MTEHIFARWQLALAGPVDSAFTARTNGSKRPEVRPDHGEENKYDEG